MDLTEVHDLLRTYLEQLSSKVRLADVLDVAVITLLLYWGLSWFRLRAARSLVIGLALLAGIYLCARWLDMYLTSWLFQAGFTAALLMLIVVFQQDIRRAFEGLTVTRLFGFSSPPVPDGGVVDVLVTSVGTLAENRIGALLVFEGRESVERHVRGGISVDGSLSLPLLHSIFNPHSPGHDGAVWIVGEKIKKRLLRRIRG